LGADILANMRRVNAGLKSVQHLLGDLTPSIGDLPPAVGSKGGLISVADAEAVDQALDEAFGYFNPSAGTWPMHGGRGRRLWEAKPQPPRRSDLSVAHHSTTL